MDHASTVTDSTTVEDTHTADKSSVSISDHAFTTQEESDTAGVLSMAPKKAVDIPDKMDSAVGWSLQDVSNWLTTIDSQNAELDLKQYIPLFRCEKINGAFHS